MDAIKQLIQKERAKLKEPAPTSPESQPLIPTPENTYTPMGAEKKRLLLERAEPEPLCPDCGTLAEVGFYRQDVPADHPQFGKLVKCANAFHSSIREKRLAKLSQLGKKDVRQRLSDIIANTGNAAMLEAAQEAIDQGYGWYYFYGGPGNAKSEALKAIVNEMNETGRGPAVYTTLGRLLMYMRQAYSKDAKQTEMERFDELVSVRVLAVDEMDKPRETDWAQEFRFNFLDARYISAVNEQTLTIYAGNPDPAVIFDEVIYDRFQDGRFRIVENKAPSSRKSMRWQSEQIPKDWVK